MLILAKQEEQLLLIENELERINFWGKKRYTTDRVEGWGDFSEIVIYYVIEFEGRLNKKTGNYDEHQWCFSIYEEFIILKLSKNDEILPFSGVLFKGKNRVKDLASFIEEYKIHGNPVSNTYTFL